MESQSNTGLRIHRLGLCVLFTIVLLIVLPGKGITQQGDIGVHDPVMIQQDGTYYIFHTGWGISIKKSEDMVTWEDAGRVFEDPPEWALNSIERFRGHIWAPDIAYHDGKYYLYYSVSAFGRNTSAIGVATNTTLHQDDPDYEWIDHGPVVESVPGRDLWNAIDPNLAFEEDGTPWLTFGSYWLGMKLVKLQDNLTSVVTDTSLEWHTIAARHRYWKLDERAAGNSENGDVEAPFIFRKNGWYYLFVSWDRCCAGEESTYKVVVGRSKDITGPYVDRAGQKMIHGGGTLVVGGNEDYAGIGHQAAYTFDGKDYLIAHGYDLSDDGNSKLLIMEMTWDDDGWPQVTVK
ncbi:MAG: arabinan endo-1,5-alpha-L-arabinosidase [Candidatus Marinimicrobia bacterium]|nr:arabinan endo-1,5-alpha-L-arabinosidase [Candidatus Neomarinimicrobiota bacterium]MCF7880243.1 arabinan endo-1,5-alpha-L-arabinosidase [Candidatus Neomarinimicrobiota bacterium]